MYPATFEYFAPSSLDEAVEVLERYGGEAKVLAGGQSLIPVMKLRFDDAGGARRHQPHRRARLARPRTSGGLRIGALVRHKTCERSELLRGRSALLGDAAPQISDPIVRNLGTVCGSLAHADPQGDWGAVMLAIGADVVVAAARAASARSRSTSFLQGPFATSLEPTEIVTEVRVPDPGPRASGTYLKLERKVGDFATAAVAVHVSLSNGTIERAGIALTGVGPRNAGATAAEHALAGAEPTDEAITPPPRLAAEAAQPWDDHRGTADYKRNVVRVFTERGLRTAVEAARAA